MSKKDDLQISGYVPDIADNKPFLQTYNRHSDSYSVFDLKPEIILISSRISQLLCSLDSIDSDINWREIVVLVELKRKLIETISKASETAFKQHQVERMNEARIKWMGGTKILLEDLNTVADKIADLSMKYMSPDSQQRFLSEIGAALHQIKQQSEH